eukprot:1519588-Karenia_brevis.AAC.1
MLFNLILPLIAILPPPVLWTRWSAQIQKGLHSGLDELAKDCDYTSLPPWPAVHHLGTPCIRTVALFPCLLYTSDAADDM